jgi:endogenous inhibitor of DNA gyrase (YacG/DUF329 family)
MGWLKRKRQKEEPRCAECDRPLTLTTIPMVSGRRDQVEVILRDLPVLSCAVGGHPLRYPLPDFGVYVIDAVFWQKNIALGRSGRLLARVKCYNCGKGLDKEPTRPGEVSGSLNIGDLPQFGIWIGGPLATCPRCQTEQVWATTEINRAISSAIVDAFKAAGLQL